MSTRILGLRSSNNICGGGIYLKRNHENADIYANSKLEKYSIHTQIVTTKNKKKTQHTKVKVTLYPSFCCTEARAFSRARTTLNFPPSTEKINTQVTIPT